VLARCVEKALLERRSDAVTVHLKLVGAGPAGMKTVSICQPPGLHSYGDEQAQVMSLPGADEVLCEGLTQAMIRFAARYEYAIKVEDVLARRSRLLFLDARQAGALAKKVGKILLEETGLDPEIEAFTELAQHYLWLPE
jgi:glycerol-3-phosphate dehydrogenase